jgi:hypothetical protein
LQNGPDVYHAKRYIEKLAIDDDVIRSFLIIKQKNDWTWEQTLMAIVIKESELNKSFAKRLADIVKRDYLK